MVQTIVAVVVHLVETNLIFMIRVSNMSNNRKYLFYNDGNNYPT